MTGPTVIRVAVGDEFRWGASHVLCLHPGDRMVIPGVERLSGVVFKNCLTESMTDVTEPARLNLTIVGATKEDALPAGVGTLINSTMQLIYRRFSTCSRCANADAWRDYNMDTRS